jgi:hypothetical protein
MKELLKLPKACSPIWRRESRAHAR